MSLHNEIMNLQLDEQVLYYQFGTDGLHSYKIGHRDARHAAAELANCHELAQCVAVSDILWRLNDIRDMLMETDYSGDRRYGCDEWSAPVRNLNMAIEKLEELK